MKSIMDKFDSKTTELVRKRTEMWEKHNARVSHSATDVKCGAEHWKESWRAMYEALKEIQSNNPRDSGVLHTSIEDVALALADEALHQHCDPAEGK